MVRPDDGNCDQVQKQGTAVDFPSPEDRAPRLATTSAGSKIGVAIVSAIGVSTFFMPFVTTDTPVRGRSQWSPMQLLVSRADLWRPAPPPLHLHLVVYQIALIYLLMLVAVLVLALPRPRKVLQLITVIGAGTTVPLIGSSGYREFGWIFNGRFTNGPLWDGSLRGLTRWQGFQFELPFYVFLAAMPLLTWIVYRRSWQ